jgi:hypothetical protein
MFCIMVNMLKSVIYRNFALKLTFDVKRGEFRSQIYISYLDPIFETINHFL